METINQYFTYLKIPLIGYILIVLQKDINSFTFFDFLFKFST